MNRWRMKLQDKFFVSILLVALIMIILFDGVGLLVSKNKLNANTQELAMELLEQISENTEASTESVLSRTFDFMTDASLKTILQAEQREIYQMGIQKYRQQIRTIGSQYFSTSSPVYAVYVSNLQNVSSWWIKYNKSFNYSNVSESYVKQILEKAQESMEAVRHNTSWFVDETDNTVYLARNILHTEKNLGETYATVVFAIDADFFTPVTADSHLISSHELIFQNRLTGMVYTDSANEALADKYVEKDFTAYGRSIDKVKMDGDRFLLIKYANRTADWNLYCAVPEYKYMGAVNSLAYYMVGVVVIAVCISLLISYIMSNSMTQNIRDLERTISRVEQGDFAVHIVPSSRDEIGDLCQHFNHMSDKIEELIQQAYREGKEKEKLKMIVLKAQVNPHFLYNSLGSIKCMARMEGKEDIARMTQALIDLLRASLGKTSEFQTVEQEIEYVRNYFVLQLYRYEDAFRVEYHIEEETKGLIMLNFILQPLVENAVFHGIEMSRGNGVIAISSAIRGDRLVLTVRDNGVGMTPEQLEGLFAEKSQHYEGLNSIGVRNVYQRIQQYFGEEYGLVYTSSPGQGCTVEVILPVFHTKEEVKTNV